MTKLRTIAVYVLALAVANYGVVASAPHAHAYDGWHPVHVVADSQTANAHGHDHDDSAPVELSISADLEENGAAPHTKTGFHSHSTPQFGPTDGIDQLAFAVIKGVPNPLDPDGLIQLNRDRPPFKPPRVFL